MNNKSKTMQPFQSEIIGCVRIIFFEEVKPVEEKRN